MSNPLQNYTSEHDTAPLLGVTVRTLRAWRNAGKGPAWVKVGKAVYYPNAAIPDWLRSLEQKPVRSKRTR
jgi:hypothetical protein